MDRTRTLVAATLAALVTFVVAACGGDAGTAGATMSAAGAAAGTTAGTTAGSTAGAMQSGTMAAAGSRPAPVQAAAQPPAAYNDAVQRLYIAYFGRAADSGGLANFESALSQLGTGTQIADISALYGSSAAVRALVDSFGNSAESNALYTGGTTQFITAIYANVFNRAPDTEGLAFWVNAVDHGGLSKGNAALSIMAGALSNGTPQGQIDARIVQNKTVVATMFTGSLTTDARVNAYKGDAAAATVRNMLSNVNENTDTATFQASIDATLATLLANAAVTVATIQPVIQQRCLPCHSSKPTFPGYSSPPAGVVLSSDTALRDYASLIYQNVVVSRFMPYGNATGMTEDERQLIASWYRSGAQ